MQTPSGFTELTKQRLSHRLALFIALVTLTISAILIAAILKARSDAVAKARIAASYLSAALAEDVEGGLDTIACAAGLVKERIEKQGDAGPLSKLEEEIAHYAPGLSAISIIGPDGKLSAYAGNDTRSIADFADYSFFRAARDNANEEFQVGRPVSIASRTIIPATERLQTKEGRFAGVVLFWIDPQMTASLYRRVYPGENGSIKVVGTDGITFAGYTLPRGYDPSLIGAPAVPEKVYAHWRFASSGSYSATSYRDGIARIYYWRKVARFPFIAVVGLDKAEAMAEANRQAILMAILGILAAGMAAAMAEMLKREFSRRLKHILALDAHRRKLREANAKLAAAKSQAEEANQSKSLFLAKISHELRTPLNAILGFAEIIRDRVFGNDLERYSQYAADIYDSGLHLLSVIRNLLDLSKIEAAKFELHEAFVDLATIEQESLRMVQGQANTRGIKLNATLAEPGLRLHADETVLKQILINLLSNAIKFTPEGGSVSLSSKKETDGSLLISVTDTGAGMSAEEIEQALEPFRQLPGKSSQHMEGTGLGLPLAAQLTELHGGSLTVQSVPCQGTSVSVRFPAWRMCKRREPMGLPNSPSQ